MEIIPLILEGIENKVKKLIYKINELKSENEQLKVDKKKLEDQLAEMKAAVNDLEEKNIRIKVAKLLANKDNLQARHQVNTLLREIDKCYALLNR